MYSSDLQRSYSSSEDCELLKDKYYLIITIIILVSGGAQ